ncbi:molybdenum cofactor biosynthesis protein MoaE [Pyruvatibacter mobilis]|uniref:molybdenum cofactor biosynthesis protein MoaE n=1 Tax=Pyruvatibacter mobilis TaxID=1712261 RepID=UPI003BAD7547
MPVRIQPEPFDAGAELMALTSGRAEIGASVTFVGQVRDLSGGEKLHTMTLEHYPAMAQAELERIEAEARTRFDVQDIEIIHRFGDLTPGDPIVLVIATSASRQPAFDAANFIMDFLKTNAPFWKKEHGEDSSHWVEARKSDDAATEKWQRR